MDEIKPLICSPSPRDIPDWLQCWNNLGDYADRYIAKYYNEKQAYKFLRDYFMDHPEYTHMVILPDDLIILPIQFERLRGNASKYPVLGGFFNRNWQDRNLWSCIVEGRNPPAWMTLGEIEQEVFAHGDNPILPVRQDYFGCTFIRRDVVEKVGEFHAFTPGASGYDYAFSLDCAKHQIPMYCDTRVQLLHLANRKGDGTQEHCGLMKCSPYCMFIPKR